MSPAILCIDVEWLEVAVVLSCAKDICLIRKWPGRMCEGSTQRTTTLRTLILVGPLFCSEATSWL